MRQNLFANYTDRTRLRDLVMLSVVTDMHQRFALLLIGAQTYVTYNLRFSRLVRKQKYFKACLFLYLCTPKFSLAGNHCLFISENKTTS